jgi:L-threonylcarbamoyladenylate synthase
MHTEYYKLDGGNGDQAKLARAGEMIRAGKLVAFPTETVYGLGANAFDADAAGRIFTAKGRPQDNPLIVHISEPGMMKSLSTRVPESAWLLADRFWPGPLTIVLPRSTVIPNTVTAGLDTVGLRLPSHPAALGLIKAAGVPIAAPSANRSGRPSPTAAEHVLEDMDSRIDAVLDGGSCSVGLESTVLSLCGEKPRLLRPGGVTLEELKNVLGEVEVDRALRMMIPSDEKVSAPGMKYRHYAPKAPLTVVAGNPNITAEYIAKLTAPDVGVICFEEYKTLFSVGIVQSVGSAVDSAEQARRIFDALRHFDAYPIRQIYAQAPSEQGIGLAVANRLNKAAGFNIVTL